MELQRSMSVMLLKRYENSGKVYQVGVAEMRVFALLASRLSLRIDGPATVLPHKRDVPSLFRREILSTLDT